MQISSPATQTDIAQANMTPQTKAVLPERILDARIGNGTVAGGLNDSIVFRVQGQGADRRILPDSKLAIELMKSDAGPRVLKQLEVAAQTADWSPKSNLKGFVFPEDTQAVSAAYVLSSLEPGGPPLASPKEPTPRTPHTTKKMMQEINGYVDSGSRAAGAWNLRGWITFMPDTARAMLTAAGAYQPNRLHNSEKSLRQAAAYADYVNGTPTHEVQHSITSRKGRYEDVRWMEEGIANLFADTPTFRRDIVAQTGITPHSYAGRLAHEPDIDLGWGPWQRKAMPKEERDATEKEQQKRYVDSVPILRGLLRMAGAHLNTTEGKVQARELLQGTELNRVAGNLAGAIIERNGIPRDKTYEPLRQHIIEAINDPRSLEKIAEKFGVKGP